MYYLNPQRPWSELTDTINVTDMNGNETTLPITFEYDWRAIIDNTYELRQKFYEKAQVNNQLIRISGRRLRRVNSIAMKRTPTKTVESYSFNPNETVEISTTKLNDLDFDPQLFIPMKTNTYLDTFFSKKGGINRGINIIVCGDPGVGKSSNLMDILINIKQTEGLRVLYVSAEMSPIDVKVFEEYYPLLGDIDFLYINEYVTNPNLNIAASTALTSTLKKGWDLIVLDSFIEVQALVQNDSGMNGKEAEKWLLDLLCTHNSGHNDRNLYSTFLCIQQKTKGGTYVGSKRLEHMTSAFLNLNWDVKENGKRYLIFDKNRKGACKEKLYYNFTKDGIVYNEERHKRERELRHSAAQTSDVSISQIKDITELFTELSN